MDIILFSDLIAELPFILMHPKPEEEEPPMTCGKSPNKSDSIQGSSKDAIDEVPTTNLIQLDG